MTEFAAIDFETANEHRSSVCSVGVVIVKNGVVCDEFYSLIKPEPNYYKYWNTKIHGLTNQDTDNAMIFPDVWSIVEEKIKELPLVAHNSVFDEGCLKAVFKLYGMEYPSYKFYCTFRAAHKARIKLLNYKLPTVSQYCGYDLSEHHHHALSDAEACAAIAMKLL